MDYKKKEEEKMIATKHRFEKRQKRLMFQLLHHIESDLYINLEKAIKSGIIPEDWMTTNGDLRTVKAVFDSYCRDRPFQPSDQPTRIDFDNIHLHV